MKSTSLKGHKGIHFITSLSVYDVPENSTKLVRGKNFDYHFTKALVWDETVVFEGPQRKSRDNHRKYNDKHLDNLLLDITAGENFHDDHTDCRNGFWFSNSKYSRLNYHGEYKDKVKEKIYRLNDAYMPKEKL